jgi:demethylmenaquinone methyltransferase/2-methoxy-6-polyprenyl-1,4-benzoquinol methylase
MFSAVPPRYDLVNRVVTLGLDTAWRAEAARALLAEAPRRVLDLCTGTGDLALEVARQAGPDTEVLALDFSAEMLARARAKAAAAGRSIRFLEGDAGALPFADGELDAVGIAFAFRNLTFRNPRAAAHLAELARVVRPGGRFVAVESSQPDSALVRPFFHAFVGTYVRAAGALISGEPAAYRYLADTVRAFPGREGVAAMLRDAGFATVESRPLLLGAAALHVATR